ncbi:FAD-dependent oxidoreductase, partial [Burkholderia pseudomallei]
REGRRGTRVLSADGRWWEWVAVVNGAGRWARTVAALVGVVRPVRARRRCSFIVTSRAVLPRCALGLDPSGVYFRPVGASFSC